jgi:periplasmic divalent cation tolerance protein
MAKPILIFTNVPDEATAQTIAQRLVEDRLAACVNILPEVHSVYRWQGQIEQAPEITLIIKTLQSRYDEVEAAIYTLHPYDVPEVIAVPIDQGLPAYLNWIATETAKSITV